MAASRPVPSARPVDHDERSRDDRAAARPVSAGPVGEIDERSWVEGIQAGDPAAFEALFRAYYQVLYEVALRYLRSHEDAEEVAQEVLCAVWERRHTWAPRGPLRPYLTTAARNRALNALHATQRGGTPAAFDVITAPPADAALSAGEWAAAVRAAIANEPPRRRAVLALRWERGLSHAEIAVVLGVTVRAVEQAHLRAMRALRERLAGARP
jgi:RNA polymerase sigma-70 factor (ECF subfamily)